MENQMQQVLLERISPAEVKNEWLADLVERYYEQIARSWIEFIRIEKVPHYNDLTDEELMDIISPTINCAEVVFRGGDVASAINYIQNLMTGKLMQGFQFEELEQAIYGFQMAILRVVNEATTDLEKRYKVLQSVSYIHDVTAIEIAGVYRRLQSEQQARFTVLYELGVALSSSLALDAVLNIAINKVAEVMHAGSVAIVLEEENKQSRVAASYCADPEMVSTFPDICSALECEPEQETVSEEWTTACTVPDVHANKNLEQWSDLFVSQECLSLACIPLLAAQHVIGSMVICLPEVHEFPTFEVDFLFALASHTASAIQNAKLFEEARGKRELGLLLEASRVFASSLNMDEILHQVARLVVESTGADYSGVLLPDETRTVLHVYAYYGRTGRAEEAAVGALHIIEPKGFTVGQGVTGRAFTSGEPILVNNYTEFPNRVPEMAEFVGSILSVPMKIRERVIGAFNLISLRTDAFTEDDISLAKGVADLAAIAIENARLYEETRKSTEETQALYDIAKVLNSTLELDEVLRILLNRMIEIVGVNRCSLFVLNLDTGNMELGAAAGMTEEECLRLKKYPIPLAALTKAGQDALYAGEPFLIPDPRYNTRTSDELYKDFEIKRSLIVPFVTRGRLVGAASIDEKGKEHEFPSDVVRLLTAVAGTAATSIENARLLERERNIAETFQRSFLPSSLPTVPGIEMAVQYKAALMEAEVGGDFYDAFSLDSKKIGILVADVSGKGLSAATYTAMGKYMIRAYAVENPSPGYVLEQFNKAFSKYAPSGMFITMFYAVLDSEEQTLVYGNAGHDQPMFYCGGMRYLTRLDITGPGLGAIPEAKYGERKISLKPEDTLFVYTDGATDVRQDSLMLGTNRLERIFRANLEKSAREAVESIFQTILDYSEGHLTDDVALMVLKKQT